MLAAWLNGDRQICSMAHVPSPEQEDAKRPHRERAHLVLIIGTCCAISMRLFGPLSTASPLDPRHQHERAAPLEIYKPEAVIVRQQRLGRRLNGLPRLDPLQARNLFGRQNPTGVAQFNRKHERAVVVEGDWMGECRRAHSSVVPSRR